jgi:hypothetical protein
MTPAINLCHGLSVIGGFIVNSEKIFAAVNDTAHKTVLTIHLLAQT